MKASLKDSRKKAIIPEKASEYMNLTKVEEHEIMLIQNDVSQPTYISPPDDSSQGIIMGKIQHGTLNVAFLVCNSDNTVSVVPRYEIEKINGKNSSELIPSDGDSVVWEKKKLKQSGGGGPVFQYPPGTYWRSTESGYRWTTNPYDPSDPNKIKIEYSRLYLS
jgi:hypothetical protein